MSEKVSFVFINPNQILFHNINLQQIKETDLLRKTLSENTYKKKASIDTVAELLSTELVITENNSYLENVSGDTVKIYEDGKYIYEMCYIHYTIDHKRFVNGLAYTLNDYKYMIFDRCIILKSEIMEDKTKLVDMTFEDLVMILTKKLVHTGVYIDTNNKIEEYEYLYHPLEKLTATEVENIKFHEKDMYDKLFMFFIEVEPKTKKINESASLLYEDNKIQSRVYIMSRYKQDDIRLNQYMYRDVTKDEIEKILKIIKTKRKVSEEELKEINELKLSYNKTIEYIYNKAKDLEDINKIEEILEDKTLNEITKEKLKNKK